MTLVFEFPKTIHVPHLTKGSYSSNCILKELVLYQVWMRIEGDPDQGYVAEYVCLICMKDYHTKPFKLADPLPGDLDIQT